MIETNMRVRFATKECPTLKINAGNVDAKQVAKIMKGQTKTSLPLCWRVYLADLPRIIATFRLLGYSFCVYYHDGEFKEYGDN